MERGEVVGTRLIMLVGVHHVVELASSIQQNGVTDRGRSDDRLVYGTVRSCAVELMELR